MRNSREPRSIVEAVALHATAHPNRPALIDGSDTTTYSELWEAALATAAALQRRGIEPGDRVILSTGRPSASFVTSYLATHLSGAAAVPIDSSTPKENLGHIKQQIEPGLLLTDGSSGADTGFLSFKDLEEEFTGVRWSFPEPGATADVLFTTGTTGVPKGVVLSHRNVLCSATNINQFIGNSSCDREVVPLPLSHSFGLGRLRCNLLAGGTIVCARGFTFPSDVFRAIEKHEATGFASVPAGIEMLLRLSVERFQSLAEQLRYMEIGSAPMPVERKKQLAQILPNTRICMHYGLTEASRSAFIEFHESPDKLDSVGRASPNVDLKIVDIENGTALKTKRSGEILVRGGMVASRYWANDAEIVEDNWLKTGDYGYLDDDGYLYLQARKSDLINVGGKKVSPVEVERELTQHDAVAACACVGVPDPKGITGEAVKAFLVRGAGEDDSPNQAELTVFLRNKLEPFKVPTEFCWIDELPATASGKVKRAALTRTAPPTRVDRH